MFTDKRKDYRSLVNAFISTGKYAVSVNDIMHGLQDYYLMYMHQRVSDLNTAEEQYKCIFQKMIELSQVKDPQNSKIEWENPNCAET